MVGGKKPVPPRDDVCGIERLFITKPFTLNENSVLNYSTEKMKKSCAFAAKRFLGWRFGGWKVGGLRFEGLEVGRFEGLEVGGFKV
jgi:hypothetical protein